MISEDFKQKILEAIRKDRELFDGSDAMYATRIGISPSQYSRISNGETDKVISDAKWYSIAQQLGVSLSRSMVWKTANTPIFQYIITQLETCQRQSFSSMLCDLSDIGKSYAARYYARNHKNVIYVDCSQVKSKQRLIRFIAKEFGVDANGRYADVYENLVNHLKTLQNPLIILDEAGDLQYEAFLEIKALWNAYEGCAYYMIGADGLKEKMQRNIEHKKVGYTELFSRFGKRYGNASDAIQKELPTDLLTLTATQIIKANLIAGDVNVILNNIMGEDKRPSLRRIEVELNKTQL